MVACFNVAVSMGVDLLQLPQLWSVWSCFIMLQTATSIGTVCSSAPFISSSEYCCTSHLSTHGSHHHGLSPIASCCLLLTCTHTQGTMPDEATIKRLIRKGTCDRVFFPIVCGTAFKNKGVQPLLDAVVAYLPSPLEIPDMQVGGLIHASCQLSYTT